LKKGEVINWEEYQKFVLGNLLHNMEDSSIINMMRILFSTDGKDLISPITLSNFRRFFQHFGNDFNYLIQILQALYNLKCFVGFKTYPEAQVILNRTPKVNSVGMYLVRVSTSTPGAFVFTIKVNDEIRKLLEKKGEEDKGEPFYEYKATPSNQGPGLFTMCEKTTTLDNIPKLFDFMMKMPCAKYAVLEFRSNSFHN